VSKKQFYVYVIYVDGVVRYIGKGSNGPLNLGLAAATIILAWTVARCQNLVGNLGPMPYRLLE
jgi:hypothetical protein